MQLVIFHPVLAHRLEGPQSHVQRDFRGFNAARFHASQNFRGEVQACRGRGHRAFFPGIDGLIALAVSRSIGPIDVRRKRHMANALDFGEEILRRERTGCGALRSCRGP